MELKGRLLEVANFIPSCHTLIDIGTDHAYIPVYAVQKGLCKFSLASDLRPGPVKIAQKNIERYGLSEFIEARIGNGLEQVDVGKDDVVVIAGMGGLLIKEIMDKSCIKSREALMLVLQPMNAQDVLRAWLFKNGFEIAREALVEDTGKIYNILCCKWTGIAMELDSFSCFLGYNLIDSVDPLMKEYLGKKLKQLETIIKGKSASQTNREGLQESIEFRDRIIKRLSELDHNEIK